MGVVVYRGHHVRKHYPTKTKFELPETLLSRVEYLSVDTDTGRVWVELHSNWKFKNDDTYAKDYMQCDRFDNWSDAVLAISEASIIEP